MSAGRGPAWLFVPGDRPDRFAKAVASGADQVICDLEDAVLPAAKEPARDHVVGWLSTGGSAWVRVNPAGSSWHRDDVLGLAHCAGLQGVVVPKVESATDLEAVREVLTVPVAPLIESAAGVERVSAIVTADRVERLLLGTVDLAADLGCDEESDVVTHARCRLLLASRAAGRAAPVDGVTRALRDPGAVFADARRARREGFAGKLAIHPLQVEPIRSAFAPTPDEVAWAQGVIASAGGAAHGAVATSGLMVDAPVVERARRILAVAAAGTAAHETAEDEN
ncbi:HpcH/HpaI aldolase/citrate lyase family protein [Jiangella alba]|uniref:Citrate lyase subunit beta / citryl-CoA lyase n=1 Tax=Jiangella alba TaxID=561176 RepID=A0A1H5L641_9ACTN|nr:CoA ester lyase [Jiangella alba]SEE72483.1 citrate lyase subunit beta / citryl-CoA lyase [Jiangella alba]